MTEHKKRILGIDFPEIIFGIVSPIGIDSSVVIKDLTKSFKEKKYDVYHIKVSSKFAVLAKQLKMNPPDTKGFYNRIKNYIKFGNSLREAYGDEFLALVAICEIVDARSGSSNKFEKAVYIIDQLKTEGEISLLRKVYGVNFFQISIYSPRDIRVDYLAKKMAEDGRKRDANPYRGTAEKLVVRDENEINKPNGQRVGKIFQLADVIFNTNAVDGGDGLSRQIIRFVDLLFGCNFHSPNRVEYGMYLAHSAALRSLDLSRQVGAAIFRSTGEIASLGSNEVPRANGGTYWCDEGVDVREYILGFDSNDKRKEELIREIVDIIREDGDDISPKTQKNIDDSQFMDALEYSRIVHAEMSAIIDACRLGIVLAGGTLYCTTFPCHMCCKHIVASGLKAVFFLEPYPKSLALDLHSDSVKLEGSSRGKYEGLPAVKFVSFHGITPRRYREFFSRGKRKESGVFQSYEHSPPRPIISTVLPSHAHIEEEIMHVFKSIIK